MSQYKFVEVETRSGKSLKPNTSARSHAIRTGLRKSINSSRTKRTTRHRVSTEPRESSRNSDLYSELDNTIENSIQPPAYRVESVCAGRVDPFNSLPIPTNLEIDHLVKYLITKFDLHSTTANRNKSWLSYALQSAPMMHSTIAMAAAAWRAESPILDRSIQIEGIRQKGEAMRLIRARLALVGSAVADEEFIFIMSTMSTLVLVEALDGDFQAAEMHLRCVYNLFNSRGGRDRFKDKYVFCKSTNLADIQVAVALGRQLIFPRMYSDQAELTASTIDDAQPPLSDSISNGSTYECVAIFTQLRQLLSAHNSPDISPEVKRAPPDIVDELILQYLYQDHANDLSDSGRRSRALVLAAHLFMSITLRHSSTRSPVVRRMCMRLQGTVGMAPAARQIWAKDKTALLWIAFVGLLGTGERVETCPAGQSFLHLFRSILREYSKDSTQDISSLRETLSTFLWDESYCQPLLVWLESRQLIGPK